MATRGHKEHKEHKGREGRGERNRNAWAIGTPEGVTPPAIPAFHKPDLGVGEVAARSGVAISALHFYEAKGLIHSNRNAGNQRRYARDVLRRVSLIKVAQRVGIPLAEIREALERLPEDGVASPADWARMSKAWRGELDDRIARLTRLRDQLDTCIGCGCLSIRDCPLRNPMDVLGRKGTGPRILDPD